MKKLFFAALVLFSVLSASNASAQYIEDRTIPIESSYHSGIYYVPAGCKLPDSLEDESIILGHYSVSGWAKLGIMTGFWAPWSHRLHKHMARRGQKLYPEIDVVQFTDGSLINARAIQLPKRFDF